jgi:hypothetical protein
MPSGALQQVVHVSDFISETIGWIKLLEDQISKQLTHPAELRLPAFEARKITYPRKGFDAWWDLAQLISQVGHTIKVFGHTHPDRVVIFIFDRLSQLWTYHFLSFSLPILSHLHPSPSVPFSNVPYCSATFHTSQLLSRPHCYVFPSVAVFP